VEKSNDKKKWKKKEYKGIIVKGIENGRNY
jgi:hypothetical protein